MALEHRLSCSRLCTSEKPVAGEALGGRPAYGTYAGTCTHECMSSKAQVAVLCMSSKAQVAVLRMESENNMLQPARMHAHVKKGTSRCVENGVKKTQAYLDALFELM